MEDSNEKDCYLAAQLDEIRFKPTTEVELSLKELLNDEHSAWV